VLIARITGALAAIIWFVGAPLPVLTGVPFPSDAQYLVMGAIAAVLGLALVPVTLTIGGPGLRRTKAFVRLSGLAVCIALTASGVALVLAATGRLGEGVSSIIPGAAFAVVAGLFIWIGVASFALRGPSTIERSMSWLGLLTGASFVAPVLASILMFYFAQGFVFTNATVLPVLLVELVLWVSFPAWLTVVVVGLSEKAAT